jgi:hypothetical protein
MLLNFLRRAYSEKWAAVAHDREKAALRVSYFTRVTNVGDRTAPEIVARITRRDTVWTDDGTSEHLLASGSIMAGATATSYVWGTGIMHPSLGLGDAQPGRVLAVRGKLTHSEFSKAGRQLGDIPLGDPGYLLCKTLALSRDPQPRYELGLIPHYVDWNHPFVEELGRQEGVTVLDVCGPEPTFFETLARCRAILSSSLHGLIFAESLRIPNAWLELSDNVVGDGFKFRDWFSLAETPQKKPLTLSGREPIPSLAKECAIHHMKIDTSALANAVSESVIESVSCPVLRRYTVTECRRNPIPIFIISYNRHNSLEKVMHSYRQLSAPVELVIHDNGSTDPETLVVLDRLERRGIRVCRHEAITTPDQLSNVNDTIKQYFAEWNEPSRYVVTDCDIDLSVTRPDVLSVFNELLDRLPKASCVGPMLRIADVPASYRLFNHVMNRHIEQFWSRDPSWIDLRSGRFAYLEAPIDTTFALHRAGEAFHRLKSGIRVHHPFEALHLDWYCRPEFDALYSITSSSQISHWNSQDHFARFANEPLKYKEFKVIRQAADGTLYPDIERISLAHDRLEKT